MDDDDVEIMKIREKKLRELQMQQAQQQIAQERMAEAEAMKQNILRAILTPEARERLGRVKLAYPELATNVENQLVMLAQTGRLNQQVDDDMLVNILDRITPKKREIRIERR